MYNFIQLGRCVSTSNTHADLMDACDDALDGRGQEISLTHVRLTALHITAGAHGNVV
jgi:hypothetical protein